MKVLGQEFDMSKAVLSRFDTSKMTWNGENRTWKTIEGVVKIHQPEVKRIHFCPPDSHALLAPL